MSRPRPVRGESRDRTRCHNATTFITNLPAKVAGDGDGLELAGGDAGGGVHLSDVDLRHER